MTTTTFDDVISAWAQRLRCQETTIHGDQCMRTAGRLLVLHGCQRVLLCGHHARHWQRRTLADLRIGGIVECPGCGRMFASLDDAARIVAI